MQMILFLMLSFSSSSSSSCCPFSSSSSSYFSSSPFSSSPFPLLSLPLFFFFFLFIFFFFSFFILSLLLRLHLLPLIFLGLLLLLPSSSLFFSRSHIVDSNTWAQVISLYPTLVECITCSSPEVSSALKEALGPFKDFMQPPASRVQNGESWSASSSPYPFFFLVCFSFLYIYKEEMLNVSSGRPCCRGAGTGSPARLIHAVVRLARFLVVLAPSQDEGQHWPS